MDFGILLGFIFSSVLLTLSPGPDILLVLNQALTTGKRTALNLSFGLVTGIFFHTAVVVFGLARLIASHPYILLLVKILGFGYLVFLSFKIWKQKLSNSTNTKQRLGIDNSFFTGLIMNATNPKVSLFFLSFFPAFLFHSEWSVSLQFLILGMVFLIQALLVFVSVILVADFVSPLFFKKKKQLQWNRIQAVVLLLIAIMLLLS